MAPPLPSDFELPLHLRDLVLHGIEDAEQVDLQHPARLVGGDLRQAHEALDDAGIVDGDIQPAEFLRRQFHQILGQFFIGDVAGKDHGLGLQRAGELGQRLVADVGQHQAGALGGKAFRGTPADAAGGTGDQHGSSVKTAHYISLSIQVRSISFPARCDSSFTASP